MCFVDRQLAPLLPVTLPDACLTDAAAEQLARLNAALARLLCHSLASSRLERTLERSEPAKAKANAPRMHASRPAAAAVAFEAAIRSSSAFAASSHQNRAVMQAGNTAPGNVPAAGNTTAPGVSGRLAPGAIAPWLPRLLAYFESVLADAPVSAKQKKQRGLGASSATRTACILTALWGVDRIWLEVPPTATCCAARPPSRSRWATLHCQPA